MANGLAVQPLVSHGGFNWVFLVEILVCGILGLFFLFYFNRLFATIVAYCIRAWSWHRYRAYIDIQALQISLLGGRLFFKSIRYHAQNVTCVVHDGHITWRYWLRQVQDAEAFEFEDASRKEKERSDSQSKSEDDIKSSSDEKGKGKEKPRSRSIGKEEKAGGKPKKELPCRISVKVSAVEAFVYNRSPVYDMVLQQTLEKAKSPPSSSGTDGKGQSSATSPLSDEAGLKKRRLNFTEKVKTNDTFGTTSSALNQRDENWTKPELPSFLRLFPVKIECKRASATLGNENTTNVVIAKVDKAAGTIDAGHAGPFDLYKLLFNFDLEKINATMRPNRDFKQLQLDAAQRLLRERETVPVILRTLNFSFLSRAKSWWQSFFSLFSRNQSSQGSVRTPSMKSEIEGAGADPANPATGHGEWHGLDRYVDEAELDEHDEWKDVEYAKASTLADIEKLHLKFYFDMPGLVSNRIVDNEKEQASLYEDDMNGSKPPDYGMEFAVYGGVVTYGPWADRQRLNLQQIFFPAAYVDAVPSSPLKPGDTRNWTVFKIFISIEEDLILRIPSREPSKDEKWQGRAKTAKTSEPQDPTELKRKGRHGRRHRHTKSRKSKQGIPGADARPYGWLDITVKTDTTVTYIMDMFPRSNGYKNTLDVDCKSTIITSSVNHGLLWRTGAVSVQADLSQPATWNSLRKWPFDIIINDMELFILRDHLFLIIDLVNDWSYGPPLDFYTFVPYVYSLRMLFRNFIMYLNVNDANIVNDPADFDKNDFLTLEGILDSTLDINMDQYRPIRNMIRFDVLTTDMRMRMLSPSRSTFSVLLKDKVVATLPKLTLSGSYSGHIEERPGLVDTLRFDIVGTGLTLKAYGFLVRQLINIKENLFGDYMHFKTLEEFQGADEDLAVANIKTASIPKPKFINELDVMLCIIAEDVTVLLPANLYSADEFIRAELPVANLDLRIISYYLDMGLQLSPVTFLSGKSSTDDDDSPVESSSETQFFVKHVNLDGHRCFGLPPDEPPYISQWDVDIGAITGEFSSSFIHDLVLGARAFIFGFQDRENSLPLPSPVEFFDPGFVQVRTDTIRLWFHVGKDALLFSAEPVEVATNDWAGETISQRVSVMAPKITLACVDGKSASRHRIAESRRMPVKTYAFFQTGAAVNVLLRKLHFEEERRRQQRSLRVNDERTGRAPFLLRRRDEDVAADVDDTEFHPPTMPYPLLPPPLDRTGATRHQPASIRSMPSYASAKQVRSKTSSSSLSASVRNGALAVPSATRLPDHERSSRTPTSSQSIRSSSPSSSATESVRDRRFRPNDAKRAQSGLPPSTIAFSSPYAEPYFPLDLVEPDESNVPASEAMSSSMDAESDASSLSDVINDPDIDHDTSQTSVIIQLLPGIRAYFEPRIVATGAKLLRKILPQEPEELMDTFQMDVLETVAARQAQRHGSDQTLEIQIGLPTARLRVVNPGPRREIDDQLDLTLRSCDALVRVRSLRSTRVPSEILAVHAKADSISASLGRPEYLSTIGPAVQLNIEDVLVWVAIAAVQSIHATVGDTILSVSGDQAEGLMDFVLRLLPVVDELKAKVEAPLKMHRNRFLLLVYALTQHNEDLGDPAFLSGSTYILRAFPDHFRNQESWKVVARLRHILQHLPRKAIDELKVKLKSGELDCSPTAPAKALNHWASFQNWDVPNVHATVAFQRLFHEEERKIMSAPQQKPTVLTLRSEYLRLAVEAAERANEFVVEEISLRMDNTPPTAPTGLMLVDENTRTKTRVQTHASSVAISANWSIFGIVERVLPLKDKLQQLSTPTLTSDQPSASERFEDSLYRHIFQIVASTDHGSLLLQSINLQHMSRADGLKLSLIGTTQAAEDGYGPCATAIVNADSAITELHGFSRQLWQTLLTSPSIYADHLRPLPGRDMPPSSYIAVGYKSLELSLLEQVPGLLRIVDSLVLDEVTSVMKLVESTKAAEATPSKVQEKKPPTRMSESPVKFHVALLAGDLRVEVSLLQTLGYELVGKAASMRLAPAFSKDRAWAIDFDVGQQNHRFVNSSADKRHEENILEVPPINGHVGVEFAREATSLSVATTMQRVEVNAAAIQEVITTVNQPEVQNVITAIRTGVEEIKGHVENVKLVAQSPDSAIKPDDKHIVFDVRFALLGVRIATAARRGRGSSIAAIEFGIGPLHALASNKSSSADSRSLLPEIRAQIRDIGARLEVDDRGKIRPCGNATLGIQLHFRSRIDENDKLARSVRVQSHGLDVNVYPDTASIVVDLINHLQDRLRSLDLSKEMEYLRQLGDSRKQNLVRKISGKQVSTDEGENTFSAVDLLSVTTTVQLDNIKIAWIVDQSFASSRSSKIADLVLTLQRIEFTTRGGHEARLAIEDLQLQLAKKNSALMKRPLNSAIMPEVTFSVGYWTVEQNRSLTFKAAGKPLEIRLESKFILLVDAFERSVTSAIQNFKAGTANWQWQRSAATTASTSRAQIFDTKKLASLLVEADFAGAEFYIQGSGNRDQNLATLTASAQKRGSQHGRYGQFASEGAEMQTTLKAPGIAVKVEYNAGTSDRQATLNGEVQVDASSNLLLPNVVPLLLEISNSVKEVMKNQDDQPATKALTPTETKTSQRFFEDESIVTTTPTSIFGKTKVDLGFRIRRQEFGLTCEPIARVNAKAELDDFYFTMNTIESDHHGHFFAVTAVATKLGAQVKHAYSREPTFTYDMDSIVLSVMNSKHLSGTTGISAILKINPTRTFINGKQLQDLLLFREIWLPPEIRSSQRTSDSSSGRPDEFFAQKYRDAAAAAAFPWNATVSIAELAVELDLGQSIGKSSFTITNLWASQAKSSNFEQNLCIGMDEMAMNSTGRMSGFIRLNKLGVRTSIKWTQDTQDQKKTPLIQASIGFRRLLTKAAFDYQAFAFGDVEGFDFLMYNVHQARGSARDRLVAVLDCDKAYVFCTSTSPARAVGLYQAFDRFVHEKQTAFVQSLRDIEKHVRRESIVVSTRFGPTIPDSPVAKRSERKTTISLHTDVVLTIGTISFGVFPGTFFDSHILKLEANNIQARFAVGLEKKRIASALGMTLGQLQVALASVKRMTAVPKALDISVDEVVNSAVNASGGIILRVPKVVASMQTWQSPDSNSVDYIFKSLFEGKIDVGWNLSRIEFIQNMWTAHSRSLANRLGKALPESAVKITAGPTTDADGSKHGSKPDAQEKITAEVNLPQSKYDYHALETPIIETPQLRDMGEATPPLEWIGLHRDRLPNVTHQIIIVSLLEVAKEVEDAYQRILGSS